MGQRNSSQNDIQIVIGERQTFHNLRKFDEGGPNGVSTSTLLQARSN
jgi:hypothetical protein